GAVSLLAISGRSGLPSRTGAARQAAPTQDELILPLWSLFHAEYTLSPRRPDASLEAAGRHLGRRRRRDRRRSTGHLELVLHLRTARQAPGRHFQGRHAASVRAGPGG